MAWWAWPVKGPSGRTERGEGSVEDGGGGGGGGGQAAQVGGAPLVIPIDWLINLGGRGGRKWRKPPSGRGRGRAGEVGGGWRREKKRKNTTVRRGNSTVGRVSWLREEDAVGEKRGGKPSGACEALPNVNGKTRGVCGGFDAPFHRQPGFDFLFDAG